MAELLSKCVDPCQNVSIPTVHLPMGDACSFERSRILCQSGNLLKPALVGVGEGSIVDQVVNPCDARKLRDSFACSLWHDAVAVLDIKVGCCLLQQAE